MANTIRIGDRDVPVQGARADTVLHSGDVVELRVKQEPKGFGWFAPDPLEAAENVTQAFAADQLTIRDEKNPDVRGWVLVVESARGFEEDDEVYVDVRLRVAGFDTRPPEMIPDEELEAGIGFAHVVTVLAFALAILFVADYAITDATILANAVGLRSSVFGFGFIDAVIAVAAAWVLVTWMKGRSSG